MILHVDANGFYASCERLFRPDLAGKPIVVLSNGDGRVIALNDEASRRGLRRGESWIRPASGLDARDVSVFYSNYALYADIGSRLVSIYNRLCPDVEVHSIQEAFLRYPDHGCPDFAGIAAHLRNTVLREIGIPVSVGVARTKTLARLANSTSKTGTGVNLFDGSPSDAFLAESPASELWGISLTASFAEPVFSLTELESDLAASAGEAVKRLKDRSGLAAFVTVHLMTDGLAGPGYYNQLSERFDAPTASLADILKASSGLLRRIYRQGLPYRKVMISLLPLDDDRSGSKSPDAGYAFLGPIRRTAGRFLARVPLCPVQARPALPGLGGRARNQKRRLFSPAYTTDLAGIPEVF